MVGCVLWGIALYKHPNEHAYTKKRANIVALIVTCLLIAAKLVPVAIAYLLLFSELRSGALWR
jgi:hypothetical protein